jgi:hypothetical protein
MRYIILALFLLSCEQYEDTGQAERWAHKMFPNEPVTTMCQQYDTDNNGYVSCTLKAGDKLVALECPMPAKGCRWDANMDCRLAKATMATQSQ